MTTKLVRPRNGLAVIIEKPILKLLNASLNGINDRFGITLARL
jgi:hypothetical protein